MNSKDTIIGIERAIDNIENARLYTLFMLIVIVITLFVLPNIYLLALEVILIVGTSITFGESLGAGKTMFIFLSTVLIDYPKDSYIRKLDISKNRNIITGLDIIKNDIINKGM